MTKQKNLSEFGVKINGLRGIECDEFFDIKPINILVGKNSSGKSTFARVFPLIRQSIEQKTKGPFLWYGRYVDFGSFDEAVNRTYTDKKIRLSFKFTIPSEDDLVPPFYRGRMFRRGSLFFDGPVFFEPSEVIVSVEVRPDETGGTYVSLLGLRVCDTEVSVESKPDGQIHKIKIGDQEFDSKFWKKGQMRQQDGLIPQIYFFNELEITRNNKKFIINDDTNPFAEELEKEVKKCVHGRTNSDTVSGIAESIPISDFENFKDVLMDNPSGIPSWVEKISQINSDSEYLGWLHKLVILKHLSKILLISNDILVKRFFSSRYIEPLRATAQRYYRRQELAVDEIDSKGANIAMYLDSLSERERQSLEAWLRKKFGFSVTSKREGGHVSLKVNEAKDGLETNIADMGFGFSQMLPIAVQIWESRNKKKPYKRRLNTYGADDLIVIEQPELHLHPAYQSKLAEVMASGANENNDDDPIFSIIAETHSPQILSKLGELVYEGGVNKEDVQVLLFDKYENGITKIKKANFDSEGILRNWPLGFFESEDV